jgi:hypothetical protein
MITIDDRQLGSLPPWEEETIDDCSKESAPGNEFFRDAVRCCRAEAWPTEFAMQFGDLLADLTEWIAEHASQIRSARLVTLRRKLLLQIEQRSRTFDETLEREIQELAKTVAEVPHFSLIRLAVFVWPSGEEVARGRDPDTLILFESAGL